MIVSYLPREKFNPIKQLGKGAFGIVTLAKNKLVGRYEAVKERHLINPEHFEDAMREAKRLEMLRHRNVVEIYDAGYLDENRGIYISMEYLKNGSAENLGFISILGLKKICLDVLSALEYAHSRNYIHRDVKPGNILIAKDGTAKLSDFGIATQLNAVGTAGPFGYKTHLAPELFRDKKSSISSDIYALGVTMHRMINGDPSTLNEMSDSQLEDAILKGEYPARKVYRPDVPPKLIKLINKALEVNPKNRFSGTRELENALREIKIKCEWTRTDRKTYVEWEGKTDDKIVNVSYFDANGEIITKRKRHEAESFRGINKLCYQGLSQSEADHKLRVILSGFESGRY